MKRLMVAAFLVSSCMALSASTAAHEPGDKKAYFDTGEGIDFEFRSFAAGLGNLGVLELDFYFSEKWVGGLNFANTITLDEEACIGSCRKHTRFNLFAERLWGGRWGHVGLRGGPYVERLFHQFEEGGRELSHVGPVFGLNLGASATVTPFRWAGVTLTASAFPGVFVGQESSPHCWDCFVEENAEPAQSFELTGMVAVLVRVGDLDGPERECRSCGPRPTSSAAVDDHPRRPTAEDQIDTAEDQSDTAEDQRDTAEPDEESTASAPVGFRSIGLAFTPHQVLEADIYLHENWAVGAGFTRGGGDRDYDCSFSRCWWLAGGKAYAERFFFLGDRWAHFGLRAGAFAGRFYSQTFAYGREGQEITREGAIIGPSLGATLNVTALRWGALTLTLTGVPGVFAGTEELGWPNRSLDDQPPLPPRSDTSFVFTGTAAFGVRFGNLDGE
ncbi:MAG: hypothetical protein ACQEVA_00540 [Myxococcota bacterium]